MKRLLTCIVLISIIFLSSEVNQSQAQTNCQLQVNSVAPVEDTESLLLNVYFTIFDNLCKTPLTNAQLNQVNVSLDNLPPIQAKLAKPSPPFYILYLLDISNSISGNIEGVQQAIIASLKSAPHGSLVALMGFDGQSYTYLDFTDAANNGLIEDTIQQISPGAENACLFDAAITAIDKLAQVPVGHRALILFTDGRNKDECSTQDDTQVITLSRRLNNFVPISTIGLYSDNDNLDVDELNKLAASSGGYATTVASADLEYAFDRVMKSFTSQLLAQAPVFTTQGDHTAKLSVTFNDGTSIEQFFTFSAQKDFLSTAPPVNFDVHISGIKEDRANNKYIVQLVVTNPEAAKRLGFVVLDATTGTKVDEPYVENVTPVVNLPIMFSKLEPGKAYKVQVQALGKDDQPLLSEKGLILDSQDFRFDLGTADMTVSVSDEGSLLINVLYENPPQGISYKVWLNDEQNNTKINGSELITTNLNISNQLQVSMNSIPAGKYLVVLQILDQNGRIIGEPKPINILYTPPRGPSLGERIGEGLRRYPWLLVGIGIVIFGLLGWLVFSTVRNSRSTGTPIIDSNLKGNLSSELDNLVAIKTPGMDFDDALAPFQSINQTIAEPISFPETKPVLRVEQSGSPSIQGIKYALERFPYSIGRQECDLTLDDPAISRQHAVIDFDSFTQKFYIQDLSRNGILLRNKRIPEQQKTELMFGDQIRLSPRIVLVFLKK